MIAAQQDRRPSGRSDQPDVLLNGLAGGGAVAQHQIAAILEPVRTEDGPVRSDQAFPAGECRTARIAGGAAAAPRRNEELAS